MPIRDKHLVLLCIFSFVIFIWTNFYVDNVYKFEIDIKGYLKDTVDIRSTKKDLQKNMYYRKKRKMKYILAWTTTIKFLHVPDKLYGQQQFKKLRCPVINCYITSEVDYFVDIRDFDVIAFNGIDMDQYLLPADRAGYQKYIYFNMESSAAFPVEDEKLDGFFNGTATYRLDSDIPIPNVLIRDENGNEIGPMIDMHWIKPTKVDREVVSHIIFEKKKQAAAIYMSNCTTLSSREEMIMSLQRELNVLGFTVDVYGPCGSLECKPDITGCYDKWATEYYFYLAYENALDVDYVTDDLLIPLQNDLIPIVYGGANYSRFLPPKSHLNAMALHPKKLAQAMLNLIISRQKYLQYFWWKKYYTYHNPKENENVCKICSAINNEDLWKMTEKYKKFRRWWNINYTAFL